MIICITMYELNKKTGRQELVVSHGIQEHTGLSVILPAEHPAELGAKWNDQIREWCIEEPKKPLPNYLEIRLHMLGKAIDELLTVL